LLTSQDFGRILRILKVWYDGKILTPLIVSAGNLKLKQRVKQLEINIFRGIVLPSAVMQIKLLLPY
jgi:hypothetical protein